MIKLPFLELLHGKFSIMGEVPLTYDKVAGEVPEWSDEFKIVFEITVDKELSVSEANVMRQGGAI